MRVIIKDGALESLKWLALVLMTLDHINKYFFSDKLIFLFQLGRIAMPIFGFVLAYNLARSNALVNGLYLRAIKNLALYGIIATPFFIINGGLLFGWWPLNILFTLLVATAVCFFVDKGGRKNIIAAFLIFFFCGAFVEFWYFGIAFIFFVWRFLKTGQWLSFFLMLLSLASLFIINGNFYALAALPIIYCSSFIDVRVPRVKRIFYTYYPAHLAIIALLIKFK